MSRRSKKERFHAYTDGSLFASEQRMGTGWVISRESNGKYLPGLRRIVVKGKLSSTLAEIYAVVNALHKVEKNSTVIIHTDDLALSKLLKKGDLIEHMDEVRKKPSLVEALGHLFNAVSRHKLVTAVHEQAKDSAHLTRAHHLSRVACWLKPRDNSALNLTNH